MTALALALWDTLSNPENPENVWSFFGLWVFCAAIGATWRFTIVHDERDSRIWRHVAWGVLVGGPTAIFWLYFLLGRIVVGGQ